MKKWIASTLLIAGSLLAFNAFTQMSDGTPPKTVVCMPIPEELKDGSELKKELLDTHIEGAPGAEVKVELMMTFAPGWHGYPNPPTIEYQTPVDLQPEKDKYKIVKVTYPAGTDYVDMAGESYKVYENTVYIPFTMKMPETKGEHKLKLNISYQQCDATGCLPPTTMEAPFTVTVK